MKDFYLKEIPMIKNAKWAKEIPGMRMGWDSNNY